MSLQLEKKVKVPEWKKREVEELTKLMEKYSVIGLARMYKVQSFLVNELRRRSRGQVTFRVARKNLVKLALKRLAEKRVGIEKLEEYLKGSVMLVLTNLNPSKLSIMLEKSKVNLTAKAGEVAPKDIIVNEGNTGIPPGPIISEFSSLKIPTKIEAGSIWITKDTVVVRKGEVISDKAASILSRLGIKPVEACLKLDVAYENGVIYTADILSKTVEEWFNELKDAATKAYNLSLNIGYPTRETLPLLLGKALLEAKNLAINASLFEKEVLPLLIAKASLEASNLQKKIEGKL
ncbi:MAG: 50S ribosomal protein L10 [Candidatus Bathyarchaeota archaeon]